MPQSTNSAAFIQRKPLENTNIGAIVEEHVRYYESVKSDDEAKRLTKEANDREFRRKLSNDRKKDLPAIDVGEAEGYYKNQRVSLFEKEATEIAELKRRYTEDGDKNALLKLDQKAQFYKSANDTTKAFQEYGKYILDNKDASFNADLDQEKLNRWEKLSKSQYVLTEKGFGIPNEEGELEFISPQQLNQEILNFSKFSGKAGFEETGLEIAGGITLDVSDGSQDISQANINEGVLKWKAKLLENPVQLNTIAKREKLAITDEGISDVQLNDLALKLFNTHTKPKLQIKKSPLGDQSKIVGISNAIKEGVKKDKAIVKDDSVSTISIQKNIGDGGTPVATTFAGNSFFVSFPDNGVKFGSPSSNGNVVYTGALILEKGGVELQGFTVDADGNKTSKRVENSNIKDINAVVKQISTGTKDQTFDDASVFYKKAVDLFVEAGGENAFDINEQPNTNKKTGRFD
tara:strand:- start:17790 stop:19172 length:1383 start_codon:yes stop_codon:yes gene_type:complete